MAAGTVMRYERKSLQKIAVSVISERKSTNLRGGNLNSEEEKKLLGSLSFQVVQFWDEGLETAIDDLGEERWMVLEQVEPEFRQLRIFFFEVALYISDDCRHHYTSHLILCF